MNSTEFILNRATIRGKLDCSWLCFCLKLCGKKKHRITCHYSTELQTTWQTLRTLKKYSNELTYSDFLDKLALINCWWKCKKGNNWLILLVHSRKLTSITISPALSNRQVMQQQIIESMTFYSSWTRKMIYVGGLM